MQENGGRRRRNDDVVPVEDKTQTVKSLLLFGGTADGTSVCATHTRVAPLG